MRTFQNFLYRGSNSQNVVENGLKLFSSMQQIIMKISLLYLRYILEYINFKRSMFSFHIVVLHSSRPKLTFDWLKLLYGVKRSNRGQKLKTSPTLLKSQSHQIHTMFRYRAKRERSCALFKFLKCSDFVENGLKLFSSIQQVI